MNYTKKIVYQSNYWYNDGLRKAQIRDMSGAIVSLRRSLQYNRENIAARNLLGLVYYGIGEVPEALVEWIISKNLRPRDNIANYFIKEVQDSANELETINQAIKKFNQCLTYCQQDGEDLAIIQLKQVVASHPTFLKAYQLQGCGRIQSGQRDHHPAQTFPDERGCRPAGRCEPLHRSRHRSHHHLVPRGAGSKPVADRPAQ